MTASLRADDLLARAFWNLWDEDPPAGDIQVQLSDQHSTFAPHIAARVEQHLSPVVKYAAWLPVTDELIEDYEGFRSAMARAADRHLRPWRYPDHPKIPTFDLFPRATRARQRLHALRARLTAARRALRRHPVLVLDEDGYYCGPVE